MGFMARFKDMWRRHDERLENEALEERAAGVEGDDLSVTPGLDRIIAEHATSREEAAEHEGPSSP